MQWWGWGRGRGGVCVHLEGVHLLCDSSIKPSDATGISRRPYDVCRRKGGL
jgi:hypothetical protein